MKKIFKAGLFAFIGYKIMDFFIHGLILNQAYVDNATAYRADMNDYMWIFIAGPFIVLMLIAKIYTLIESNKRCMFMVLMPFVIMIPAAFYSYAMINVGLGFTWAWFGLGLVQTCITLKIMSQFLGKCSCVKCSKKCNGSDCKKEKCTDSTCSVENKNA